MNVYKWSLIESALSSRYLYQSGGEAIFENVFLSLASTGYHWQGTMVEIPSTSRLIRVMLVDDHKVVRSGLTALLYAFDDFELVGEASDGEEAVALCQRVQPDVILMDLIMPRMDGPTATQHIRQRFPKIQILVLTSFKEDELVHNALKAGAIGYLLKNVTPIELANAIRAAHHGRTTLAPEAAEVLIHSATHQNEVAIGHDLTGREREVLDLMVRGLDNNKIADILVVSRSTVKFHVSNILSKLFVSSRTEAVVVAIQHHLVSPVGHPNGSMFDGQPVHLAR